MSKLLDKPLKYFSIYALVILLLSVPVYYYIVDYIWLNELDEHNEITLKKIKKNLSEHPQLESADSLIQIWNNIMPGIEFGQYRRFEGQSDSTFTLFKPSTYSNPQESDRFRLLTSPVQIGNKIYKISIETNVEEADETILGIGFVTLIFFVFLVLGFLLLNRKISKIIWQPFYNTLERIRQFNIETHETIGFDKVPIEEFEELNHSLEKLISQNVESYKQQRRFVENASHELQTPIAILKAKIDQWYQNDKLLAAMGPELAELNVPLNRIIRINKNLLLLAKIENNQFADEVSLDVSASLEELLDYFTEIAHANNNILHTEIEANCMVQCNKFLFESMVSNLMTNAVKHGKKGETVDISLKSGTLTVKNYGDEALNTETIFKRFSIHSKQNTNSGLGLAIVKEICNKYNWQVYYHFGKNQHQFSVNF